MTTGTMLWAGKKLSADEELRTRRLVALLRRIGDDKVAETFERFLPENDHRWTPDQLEVGAQAGPWASLDGVRVD
jgi:HEPN domain-containing protein